MNEISVFHVSLKMFLWNRQDQLLVLQCQDTSNHPGFWDIPGGRIDRSEQDLPLSDTLRREVLEEIGDIEIDVAKTPILATKATNKSKSEPYDFFYVFYEARLINGTPTISEEHSDFKWVYLSEVNVDAIFYDGIREAVREYLNQRNNEQSRKQF